MVYTTREAMEEAQAMVDDITEELLQIALDLKDASRLEEGDSERSDLLGRSLQLESERRRLSFELSRAQVPCGSAERVEVGSVVTIRDLGTGKEQSLTLVSANGNPLKRGTISLGAPVAQALLGHCLGDEVEVLTLDKRRAQRFQITVIGEGEPG
ncbi:MAG: GreA/GreB family elongation factor [bacterium]|nr:GreA/GreB family elongation factor [bacterium]